MNADAESATLEAQARAVPLAELLAELGAGVECAARELDQLQGVMLELVRRAGAERDSAVVEGVQGVDPLIQRLQRLAQSASDLTAAVRSGPAASLALALDAQARHRLTQGAAAHTTDAGDCDFF